MPINHDVAWTLWLAEQVLQGRALYRELLEVNPPLVVWLNLPVVWLASVLGVHPYPVFYAALFIVMTACTALTLWLLSDRRLLYGMLFVLVLGPFAGTNIGQREHLCVGLLLPFLALAVRRTGGTDHSIPRSLALLVGVLAGVAVSLKPYLAPIWVLIAIYRRPAAEDLALLVTGAAYLLGVALLAPEYVQLLKLVGGAYLAFGRSPVRDIMVNPAAIALYLSICGWLGVRLLGARAPTADVFSLATLGAGVAVLLQHKGWGYHFYPVVAFSILTAAAAMAGAAHGLTGTKRLGGLAFASGMALVMTVVLARRYAASALDPSGSRAKSAAIQGAIRDGEGVLVLSSQLTDAWPAVPLAGGRWAGRLPCLWFIEVFGRENMRKPEEMGVAESTLFRAVVTDLVRRPELLVIETPDLAIQRIGRRFDVLAYLRQDSTAARALDGYRFQGTAGEFAMWVRN